MRYIVIILFNLLPVSIAYSQRQVVVIKKDRVIGRYRIDDFIQYSTKGKKQFVRDRIVELTDTTIITQRDTVPYYKIKLIDVNERGSGITVRELGGYLIVAGALLPLGDWINVRLIQDNHYEFDRGIGATSATMIGVGALCVWLDKRYRRVGINVRLKIINSESPFYKSDLPVKNSMIISPH